MSVASDWLNTKKVHKSILWFSELTVKWGLTPWNCGIFYKCILVWLTIENIHNSISATESDVKCKYTVPVYALWNI